MKPLPVSEPNLGAKELAYVSEAVSSTWISSRGEFLQRFETALAHHLDVGNVVLVSNGTAALHLSLLALGVGPGDEVIVPSLTYVATANAVRYVGATPVFVDCDTSTWTMDVEMTESLINQRTKALLPVHLYGASADMTSLTALADRHGIAVLEDAAEAIGTYAGTRCAGTIGDIGIFSFFANKTITTGEGGAVVTNSDRLAATVRKLSNQGQSEHQHYWHDVIGYNYRMTNMQAAVGLAQIERVDELVGVKQQVDGWYRSCLAGSGLTMQESHPGTVHGAWMFTAILDGATSELRDAVMRKMADHDVETRPIFPAIHHMPMYVGTTKVPLPVTDGLSAAGISLPTSSNMTEEQVRFVSEMLLEIMEETGGNG